MPSSWLSGVCSQAWKKQKLELSKVPYDYEKRLQAWQNGNSRRPNHPVTMMIKHVLRLIINLLELPANPLDNLIHLCGGREVVAELTGRAVAMEVQANGKFEQVRPCTRRFLS